MSDTNLIRPADSTPRRPVEVGQVWVLDDNPAARWLVLTPIRVIALFAGGDDHTPASLVHAYHDRLHLEAVASVYASRYEQGYRS